MIHFIAWPSARFGASGKGTGPALNVHLHHRPHVVQCGVRPPARRGHCHGVGTSFSTKLSRCLLLAMHHHHVHKRWYLGDSSSRNASSGASLTAGPLPGIVGLGPAAAVALAWPSFSAAALEDKSAAADALPSCQSEASILPAMLAAAAMMEGLVTTPCVWVGGGHGVGKS